MAQAALGAFIHQLTRTMAAETLAEASDRELVAQFLADGREAVFEALVRRHGPMVYRVCWRVLQHPQDCEDVFQATFLLLAQKLNCVRQHASLASWLHGVAHRLALKVRARAATRRRHEQQPPIVREGPADQVAWGELCTALDAELAALPEKWRLPLILCYLEGLTQDEAAGQLGWGKNTLRRRLEEARAALGRRLARRGVGPEALASVLLADCVAPAALSQATVLAVVTAATRAAAAPAPVAALLQGLGATRSLLGRKLGGVLLLAVGFLAAGAGLGAHRAPAAQEQPEPPPHQVPAADPLAGTWLMTLPAGFQYQVTVWPLGGNRYSLRNAVRFSGVYELREDRLVLTRGTSSPAQGFEWKLLPSGELSLVAQPPPSKIGQNYLGATLKRQARAPAPARGSPKKAPPNLTIEGKRVLRYTREFTDDYYNDHKEVYYAYPKALENDDGTKLYVDVWHGPMVGYHKNGRKSIEGVYRHGRREGVFAVWAANGTKTGESHWVKGQMHGKYTQWSERGRKIREELYKKGKLDGDSRYWDAEGRLVCQGTYRSGQPWSGTFLELTTVVGRGGYAISTCREGKKVHEEKLSKGPWQ